MEPVIVDSSVWTRHLREPFIPMVNLLRERKVLAHPLVTAELMLGRVKDRTGLMEALRVLPPAPMVEHETVLELIEWEYLHGHGIGYVDAHLLASARARPGVMLWTDNPALCRLAEHFGVAAE